MMGNPEHFKVPLRSLEALSDEELALLYQRCSAELRRCSSPSVYDQHVFDSGETVADRSSYLKAGGEIILDSDGCDPSDPPGTHVSSRVPYGINDDGSPRYSR